MFIFVLKVFLSFTLYTHFFSCLLTCYSYLSIEFLDTEGLIWPQDHSSLIKKIKKRIHVRLIFSLYLKALKCANAFGKLETQYTNLKYVLNLVEVMGRLSG